MNRRPAGFSRLFLKRAKSVSSHVFHEIYLHVNGHAKSNGPLRLKACTSRLKPAEDNKYSCSNTTS